MSFRQTVTIIFLSSVALFGAPVTGGHFDSVAALPGAGWTIINNSTPGGSTSWFQGDTGIFSSQSGAANSYVAANFNAAPPLGGDISLWLLLPPLTLLPGDSIVFFTRTEAASPFADRMEVRLSTNGGSSDVGATTTSVGDFTTLLATINPTQTIGLYPETWTAFTLPIPVLTPTLSRIGFRYFVTDTTANGNYIGIDTVSITSIPEPASFFTLGFAGIALGLVGARQRVKSNKSGI